MKTCELEGAVLDLWVARAEGHSIERANLGEGWMVGIPGKGARIVSDTAIGSIVYSPSRKWSHAGQIIERERIALYPPLCVGDWEEWEARAGGAPETYKGKTALIAAMRAYICSIFGPEVSDAIPDRPSR